MLAQAMDFDNDKHAGLENADEVHGASLETSGDNAKVKTVESVLKSETRTANRSMEVVGSVDKRSLNC